MSPSPPWVLVDSNVILDVVTEDATWFDWSAGELARAAGSSRLAINPLIYAEVSIGYERVEDLERALPKDLFVRLPLPWPAAFLAGKCFLAYRRNGGRQPTPLPDFYIGAHAAVERMALLTRDPKTYRTYLPGLQLIAPKP